MLTKTEYLNKLQQFKLQYSSEYCIDRIGIFGSVARDEQTEKSDNDIPPILEVIKKMTKSLQTDYAD